MKVSGWVAAFKAGKIDHSWANLELVHGSHRAVLKVSADAPRIIEGGERVRHSGGAYAVQQLCDLMGAVMATARILEARNAAATVWLAPLVASLIKAGGNITNTTAVEHSAALDRAIQKAAGTAGDWLISNLGKQFILDNLCSDTHAVNYGWFVRTKDCGLKGGVYTWKGTPTYPSFLSPDWRVLQDLGNAHGFGPDQDQDDYSQQIILVDGTCMLDGSPCPTTHLYTDPELCHLVTHDGKPLKFIRHPHVPDLNAPVEPPKAVSPVEVAHPTGPVLGFGDGMGAKESLKPYVQTWQHVLVTAGFDLAPAGADGGFGKLTLHATETWQTQHGLVPTGIVDAATWAKVGTTPTHPSGYASTGLTPLSAAERGKIFGVFQYRSAPLPTNPENIIITDDWPQQNIVQVSLPGSEKLIGGPGSSTVAFHHLAAKQLFDLWEAWKTAGLLDHVLSWGGSWVPRFVRGSRTNLSNHATGTAFDINVPWNQLGSQPAPIGAKGSVLELVPLAREFGFFWGGDFATRCDPMHFEVAKLL